MIDNNDSEWMNSAACRAGSGVDPEIFFPQHVRVSAGERSTAPSTRRQPASAAPAKALCRTCPVQIQCLKFALDHGFCGVWGGMSQRERETKFGRRPAHGTLRCYYGGCRCLPCMAVHDRDFEQRRLRRAGLLGCPPGRHGTETGWNAYRCRCAACVAAHEAVLWTAKDAR